MQRIVSYKDFDRQRITGAKWFKVVSRYNSPFFDSLLRTGAIFQNPRFNFKNPISINLVLNRDVFARTDDFEALKRSIVDPAKKNPTRLASYYRLVITDHERYLRTIRALERMKIGNDPTVLLKMFKKFVDASVILLSHLWPPLAPDEWLGEAIRTELGRTISDPGERDQVYHQMIRPQRPSMAQQRLTAIWQLAAHGVSVSTVNQWVRGDRGPKTRGLEQSHGKFAWILDDKITEQYETRAAFGRAVRKLTSAQARRLLTTNQWERQAVVRAKRQLISHYRLTHRAQQLCQLAADLPYIRLIRREAIAEAVYRLQSLFQQISRQIKVPHFYNLFYWEIEAGLRGRRFSVKKIEQRHNGFGLFVFRDCIVETDVPTANQLKRLIESPTAAADVLHGSIACQGTATGIVRVLGSARELHKVKPGDILVTMMTTPDFLPAMDKAAAFITDEGGISCHAAIVAREMKKPCLIGTKVATKVFKDGDRVEVDAMKGIVRKINN